MQERMSERQRWAGGRGSQQSQVFEAMEKGEIYRPPQETKSYFLVPSVGHETPGGPKPTKC